MDPHFPYHVFQVFFWNKKNFLYRLIKAKVDFLVSKIVYFSDYTLGRKALKYRIIMLYLKFWKKKLEMEVFFQ